MKIKKSYINLAIVLVAVICLGYFLYTTDWPSVLVAIRHVGFNFGILIFITFVSYWLGVLAWRCCMPKESAAISGWQLFWIRLFGEMATLLNPTSIVGGEALKIFLLREKGVEDQWALHSILLSRAMMFISMFFLMFLMAIWFVTMYAEDFYWLLDHWPWLLLLLAIGLLLYSFRRHRALQNLPRRIPLSAKRKKFRLYMADLWQKLTAFYRQNKWAMFMSFVYSCLHWIVGSLEFYFILLFLGVKTTVINGLLVDMGVVVIKAAGSFVPGQIGIEEYGNKVMMEMIGITGATLWVTASILRRARQLFWIVVSAVMYFFIFKKKRLTA